MGVAGIALRMLRHARPKSLPIESMTEITPGSARGHTLRIHLTFHLLRVCVISMRKPLQPELSKTGWEVNPRTCCVDWGLMADNAHLACRVGEVFCVTLDACRMSRKCWRGIVSRTQMANSAVLRFGFVFFAVVIEGRQYFNDLRVDYVKS
jgi:hypothetical protein